MLALQHNGQWHIATGGFHFEYDEAGVGEGWKNSGVPRHELYIQTLFLAQSVNGYRATNCKLDHLCPPPSDLSIEDQVHLSIKSSLSNLKTTYIDAVLVHNFRAKLQPYEETIQVWRVLEKYVDDDGTLSTARSRRPAHAQPIDAQDSRNFPGIQQWAHILIKEAES